jgi:TatD DNase family protein
MESIKNTSQERLSMLVDTHCHINLMVKKSFESPLTKEECQNAKIIIDEANNAGVTLILCVGTNAIESENCTLLARQYPAVYASVGLHPNDAAESWQDDLIYFKKLLAQKENNKIVAIGECGIDRHYPGYNLQRQKDVFKAQIELALEHDLALIIHSRDAHDETLYSLDEFNHEKLRGTMHCFEGSMDFAQEAIKRGFVLGIGGTVTYPRNTLLRDIVKTVELSSIILETDSPYLPPQSIRGKTNTPAQIKNIAEYIGELRNIPLSEVALTTTGTVKEIFRVDL